MTMNFNNSIIIINRYWFRRRFCNGFKGVLDHLYPRSKEMRLEQLLRCENIKGLNWVVESSSKSQTSVLKIRNCWLVISSGDPIVIFRAYICSHVCRIIQIIWTHFKPFEPTYHTFQSETDFKLNSHESFIQPKIILKEKQHLGINMIKKNEITTFT